MSYLKATQQGYIDAEATIEGATQEALRSYREAKAEIDALLAKQYAKLSDVSPENYYNEMIKYDRLKTLSADITKIYKAKSTESGKTIVGGLQEGMTENYYKQQYVTSWIAGKPTLIDPKLVEFTTTGNVKYWADIQKKYGAAVLYAPQAGTLAQLFTKNYTSELDRILRTMENGFIQGKSYTAVASSISDIIGKYIKKTDAGTGAMASAIRIARTEGQRVLNAAALANAQNLEAQGESVEKEWLSSLDDLTRTSHQALDNQRKPLDKDFISPTTGARGMAPGQMNQAGDNINCRCTTMTIVDGAGPQTRIAIDPVSKKRVPIDYTSYTEWIKQF